MATLRQAVQGDSHPAAAGERRDLSDHGQFRRRRVNSHRCDYCGHGGLCARVQEREELGSIELAGTPLCARNTYSVRRT